MADLCPVSEAHCFCERPDKHNGPHMCRCGGAWQIAADGSLIPVSFPKRMRADKSCFGCGRGPHDGHKMSCPISKADRLTIPFATLKEQP